MRRFTVKEIYIGSDSIQHKQTDTVTYPDDFTKSCTCISTQTHTHTPSTYIIMGARTQTHSPIYATLLCLVAPGIFRDKTMEDLLVLSSRLRNCDFKTLGTSIFCSLPPFVAQ